MNVNSTSNSTSFSPCKVVSKFFASSPVMDESLSEFKEKKGACKGPKNSQKPTVNKAKPKKLPKRIKGQKDIRTALKSKKNEQLTYAKEFDEVCKEAGVDIDSEQLQLAIALSKSLQSSGESESNSSQKPLNSQERTKKIRTTLQEYGFAVPEIKVTKKRLKNRRKNYKLLLSTDTEKQQIVSDRYAQVLFTKTSSCKCIDNKNVDHSSKRCYFVATGITYMTLQNNSALYVENLVEKSTSKGSLLRDWASIPGRPVSPVRRDPVKMNISEIECSQEELDIVLSGTLKSAKDVVKKKVDSILSNTPMIVIDFDSNSNTEQSKENEDNTLVNEESEQSAQAENTDVSNNKTLSVSDRIRSCSPDIFDDEESLLLDSNNDTSNPKSETKTVNVNVVMDLTDDDVHLRKKNNQPNVNGNSIVMDLTLTESHEDNCSTDLSKQIVTKISAKPISQCSQGSNYTRRNSNDYMEITECVGISPKNNSKAGDPIHKVSPGSNKYRRYSDELMDVIGCVAKSYSQVISNEDNLHTTISQVANKTKRKSNDLMEMTECIASTSHHIPHNVETNIDLTQNSDENNTTVVDGIVNNISEKVDLTQSSNSVDELPIVQMSENNNSLDDTIILSNDEICVNNPTKSSAVMSEPCHNTSKDALDLTGTPPSPVKMDNTGRASNKSFFDEFDYNHSDETSKGTLEKSDLSQTDDLVPEESNDKVDLTQSSDSSVASTEQQSKSCSIQTSKSSLGKKDDVSIDYDEMYDLIANHGTDVSSKKDESRSSVSYDLTEEYNGKTGSENISLSSQAFDLSDKELEYSLNVSRYDAGWANEFGGISVIDRDLSVRKSGINIEQKEDTPNHTIDKSMSESFLPMVKVKSNIQKPTTAEDKFKTPVTLFKDKAAGTPLKAFTSDNAVTIDTPTSNEYIVKTDQVTPIMDYASMTTPERNRELNKYGLKPFKRKRAIQLLTHLYNQTHPVVEACQEDLPSPSKRRKPSQPSPKKNRSSGDLKKVKSPRKLIKSPVKKSQTIDKAKDVNKENNVYEVTTEFPEIKAVECSEEDWVFQKREKAKVHSCRLPLHIALHNYVSCRRRLREAILRYEPVNIDVMHKELAASGHRYDPKDLLKYLDKKCITVKTADNNGRNNKR
ncbi:hypothetical protein ABMA28_010190 [Loxostege sticticalis]|uniref:Structure-specific endonuclease subunit SLX4 n=1 Tax=Loxostege sticticalis TaxID=481309 RepID=A0ABD0SAJ4_LOXSC